MTDASPGAFRIVEFPAEGASLRGRFYEHAGSVPRATLLMTHGFTGTITGMVADRYAEALHAAGLNVLLFDHQGFGLSGGEPRRILNRWLQIRGYRHALDFASTLPGVDAARLAIWGDSFSGSVCIAVAACDERVRALVVQVPACGSAPPPPDPEGRLFEVLRKTYREGDIQSRPRQSFGPMAVVSHDSARSPSLLAPITAFRWFIDYGGRPGTGWRNEATYVEPDTPGTYHAGLFAPHMQAASFWVIANDDEMEGAEPHIARLAFDSAPQPRELLEVAGGHFGLLYHPGELFEHVAAAQADFLVRHLEVEAAARASR